MFSVDYIFIKNSQDKVYSEMIYEKKDEIAEYIKKHGMDGLFNALDLAV